MNLGPHATFIIAAYAIAALVVIGLILWVEIDNRMQRQQLAKLKEQGVSRRSETTAAPAAEKPAESTA
jgi:heme exporter protein D